MSGAARMISGGFGRPETGYRGRLESHLRGRAEALLRDPQLTIAEVAYALGYEDAANFGRACRGWFGTSPGRHRAHPLRRE